MGLVFWRHRHTSWKSSLTTLSLPRSTGHPGPSPLLNLPDELLLEVIDALITEKDPRNRQKSVTRTENIVGLAGTNKRLRELLRPYLFRNISIRISGDDKTGFMRLLDGLETSLDVARYTCSVSISQSAIPEDKRMTHRVVLLLYRIRHLKHLSVDFSYQVNIFYYSAFNDVQVTLRTVRSLTMRASTYWLIAFCHNLTSLNPTLAAVDDKHLIPDNARDINWSLIYASNTHHLPRLESFSMPPGWQMPQLSTAGASMVPLRYLSIRHSKYAYRAAELVASLSRNSHRTSLRVLEMDEPTDMAGGQPSWENLLVAANPVRYGPGKADRSWKYYVEKPVFTLLPQLEEFWLGETWKAAVERDPSGGVKDVHWTEMKKWVVGESVTLQLTPGSETWR